MELYTDASKLGGLAYILTQPKGEGKHKCGSTALSTTQANYSVTELELLAILWALQKASFYCKGAPKISVYTDHSAFVTLTKKELIKVENTRLVSMLEKLADFNIEVFHLPGSKNSTADFLSRHTASSRRTRVPKR